MTTNISLAPRSGADDKINLAAQTAQRHATNPLSSVWVSASAGSGKTKVLTDRVLRLLLDGNLPQRILCLTFTKAAAAEMANRLRTCLGLWATLSESKLEAELFHLLGRKPTKEETTKARTLFTLALETPEGPRIQTIHSFCQSLLKRFPLEAGLSPHFRVVDEIDRHTLFLEAQTLALNNPDKSLQEAISYLATVTSENEIYELSSQLINERSNFLKFLNTHKNIDNGIASILGQLGIDLILEDETLVQESLSFIPKQSLVKFLPILSSGSISDQKFTILTPWLELSNDEKYQKYNDYLCLFLTNEGSIRTRLISQKLAQGNAELEEIINKEAERVFKLEHQRKSHLIAKLSAALLKYTHALFKEYERLKSQKHLLDYYDLISKTIELLTIPNLSSWVLYKLDGGLDHILIDEAQDTNEEQWKVITQLGEEFFLKSTNETNERTFFVVGDKKQSIYSFQGANPQAFEQMFDHFKAYALEGKKALQRISLDISFRSTPEILKAVDAVFSHHRLIRDPATGDISHIPNRMNDKGCVEVWPLLAQQEDPISSAWQPQDQPTTFDSPQESLAKLIGNKIKYWIQTQRILPSTGKPIRPGDVMVLVRRRTKFVDALIRHLKQLHIPVSGVDRMVLLDQLPAQDILKIIEFVLLPEDDLSLATILKGPLFNLSEEELFLLANPRKKVPLWLYLQKQSKKNPSWGKIVDILSDLINKGKFFKPFDFLSYIYGPLCGRQLWQARLGPEAMDPLDELLNLSLTYEQNQIPSLQGFFGWITQENLEIKRDLENIDQVRILTVHGAKGLQAPIVFLPDTTQIPSESPSLLWSQDKKVLLWTPSQDHSIPLTETLKETFSAQQEEEYYRLLYVALTRAEDFLYICGWQSKRSLSEKSWYNLISQGLRSHAEEIEFDFTPFLNESFKSKGLRLSSIEETQNKTSIGLTFTSSPANQSLPEWINQPIPEQQGTVAITPSSLGEPINAHSASTQRGTHIHYLLETLPRLPAQERFEKGLTYLSHHKLSFKEASKILSSILKILKDYPFIFSKDSYAEVAITGKVGHQTVNGQVDRLVVTEQKVYIIDYKSTSYIPNSLNDIPASYLIQLSLYQTLVAQIYPTKSVECALLWTNIPRLDFIPSSYIKLHDPLIDSLSIPA